MSNGGVLNREFDSWLGKMLLINGYRLYQDANSNVTTIPSVAAFVFANTRLAALSATDSSFIFGLKCVSNSECAPAAFAMPAASSASIWA